MLGEPLSHLLVGPCPLKGVGVQAVVLPAGGQPMLAKFLPTGPRVPRQVVIPERPGQQLRLVQPRSVGRREPGPPPVPAARPIRRGVPRRMTRVTVLDQEHPLQAPVPAAEAL